MSGARAGDARAGDGYLAGLRRAERHSGGLPRIGRNKRLRDEAVALGQDPTMAFPPADLSEPDADARRPSMRVRFLGFYGAHGALPLLATEEVARWAETGDRTFVRFADVFAARFLQLFFRAFPDARRIAQFDRPDAKPFQGWIAALGSLGSPAFRDPDRVDDTVRLPLMPLAANRVKSPDRLRQMLEHHLGVPVRIDASCPSGWCSSPTPCRASAGRAARWDAIRIWAGASAPWATRSASTWRPTRSIANAGSCPAGPTARS